MKIRKMLCIAACLSGLMSLSSVSYAEAVSFPPTHLVADWQFDNPFPWIDSADSHDLTPYGDAYVSDGWAHFDGSGDYAEANDPNQDLALTDDLAVTARIRIDEYPQAAQGRIFCKRDDTGGDGYALQMTTEGKLRWWLYGTEYLESTVSVELNEDTNIAVTWNGTTREGGLWIDDAAWFMTFSHDLTATEFPFRIASQTQYEEGANYFAGEIDYLRVYNVPEPATLSLLAFGALAVMRRW